jgi:hypothetical protein
MIISLDYHQNILAVLNGGEHWWHEDRVTLNGRYSPTNASEALDESIFKSNTSSPPDKKGSKKATGARLVTCFHPAEPEREVPKAFLHRGRTEEPVPQLHGGVIKNVHTSEGH